jgi:hypothetical protein
MENTQAAWNALPGTTLLEKLASIGIERGRMVEIRHLDAIGRDYGIAVYLFFERDLATGRTVARVEAEFRGVPEYERPYIRVDRFLSFTRENDPSFARTLDEFPMMIEVASVREEPDPVTGGSMPVIAGLMPFLDEFDVEEDPVQRSGQKLR